jgi:HAD superfamily, subfamily IIIB (Acid phosphatase)
VDVPFHPIERFVPMIRNHPALRRPRLLAAATATAAAVLGAFALVSSATAENTATGAAVPPPPAVPTSADQIQNIDQVKTAIKGYYGDTTTNQVDPVDNAIDGGDKLLHQFNPAGSYANEMAGVVDEAQKFLRKPNAGTGAGTKAVLFDVDDTTLNTYSYEIYSNFVYNPSTNAAFVNACLTTGCVFPAVPHMVDLENYAEAQGYTVFFLTGRGISQHAGTLANLTSVGYDVTDANLYLKDASGATEPWLSSCAPTCSTIQYKSLTRQHIESLGYDIVANFGDQYSDLSGGFADATFKIPNPMYYLP